MKELEFIYKRYSVRKFKDTPILEKHIKEIIKAATYAPSGKNTQNWHFVVITCKNKINEIANIIHEKNATLGKLLPPEKQAVFSKGQLHHTFFKNNAPALVLAYAGPYSNNTAVFEGVEGLTKEEFVLYKKPHSGIQNLGAAFENLLLAAANLGYGTCWMAGPTYAYKEISDYIDFENKTSKKDFYMVAITPLGIPLDDKNTTPPRKPLEEVLTIIE